jgi:dihydrofolate reductase
VKGDRDAQGDRERVHEPGRGRAGARRRRRGSKRRLRARRLAHALLRRPVRKRVLESIVEAGGFLLGRRTYEILAAYWPNAPEEEQVIAEPLNTKPKYVASTTLSDPLAWENSTVLQGDVVEAVAALKREDGADVHVIGSTELMQTLIEHGLVDEFRLMIDPVKLGGGKRFFRDDGSLRPLRLVGSEVTTTGAILATYAPAEP